MKLKVLVCGAVFSTSGYAEHARVILRALRTVEDKIDLYILPYKWSSTTDTYKNEDEIKWFKYLISKFNQSMLGHFDISIQLGVPTEWKKYAKYNIGATAGVETLSMNPEWIDHCNNVDKIITVSEFSKRTIVNCVLNEKKVQRTVDVIPYPVKKLNHDDNFKPDITTKFNFLSINQWAPRKNIDNMIHWFVQVFKDNADVGLILKTYHQSNSTPDYYNLDLLLYEILYKYEDRKCKVYFVHGDLTDEQINSLYTQYNVKAYVNNAHGEGYCLPIFHAACHGIPVVAPDFSGYKDFLYQNKEEKPGKFKLRPFFQRVDVDINPVQQNHIMPGIINPGMLWGYPKENDFKIKIKELYKDYPRFKKQAQDLQKIIKETHDESKIYQKFVDCIFEKFDLSSEEEVVEVI